VKEILKYNPMENQVNNLPKIIIIGGGFGGIQFSKKLKKQAVEVLMLDKHNYHTFQPLLYQVATGGLEPDSIAFPLRKVFKGQSNFTFRVACAQQIVAAENKVITNQFFRASRNRAFFYAYENCSGST
jgi:NADH dehydrogenase